MFCNKCGTQNPDNAAFCKGCGARLSDNQKAPVSTAARTPVNAQRTGTKKRKPIFTTKKTYMTYWIGQVLGDSLFVGLGVFCFIRAGELIDSYWYRSDGEKMQALGFAFMLVWFLSTIYHMMVIRTYADVHENRITGSGMQGIQAKSFDLRFEQIAGISISKGFLNLEAGGGAFLIINTSAGEYKVITTQARANEIVEYYANYVRRTRPRRER